MRHLGGFLLLSLLVGCGGVSDAPQLAECQGNVTYNGKPVAGATVTFLVEKRPLAMGTTNAEGKFTLTTNGRKGAPVGMAKVGIVKQSQQSAASPAMKPEDMMKMQKETMGSKKDAEKPEIPSKYAIPASSGLTADVSAKSGDNQFEFPLVD